MPGRGSTCRRVKTARGSIADEACLCRAVVNLLLRYADVDILLLHNPSRFSYDLIFSAVHRVGDNNVLLEIDGEAGKLFISDYKHSNFALLKPSS